MDFLLIRLGYGIEGVAFAGTLCTYFIYSCIVIGYALSHYTRKLGEWVRFFLQLWVPFIYMILLLWSVEILVDFFIISKESLLTSSIKVILYLFGCIPLIYRVARKLKLDFSRTSLTHLGIMR